MGYSAILLVSCATFVAGVVQNAHTQNFLRAAGSPSVTKVGAKADVDGHSSFMHGGGNVSEVAAKKDVQGGDASGAAAKGHHKLNQTNGQAPASFPDYYNSVLAGRGIWKWNTALWAYQRHFAGYIGKPVSLAEVGVQSGGSLLMWKNVLGPQSKLYGLDINPACSQFAEPGVDITIGDQGDWNMWQAFIQKVGTGLDILVDDGSHLAPHMFTTFTAIFPHTHPGGFIAIEDIHGTHYAHSFFAPTAQYLAHVATTGQVHSVHLYPTLLVVRKAGQNLADAPFAGAATPVADFQGMWTAINTNPPGTHIVLRNPAWPTLFTNDALANFFNSFIDLHAGAFKDTPPGCSSTSAAVCTNAIEPMAWLQTRVSGVHIYQTHAVIEIPAVPPVISAVRKGTQWIEYGGAGA